MNITPAVFFAALALAIVCAVISVIVVIRKYSMKHTPVDYPLDQFTQLDLQERSDLFIRKEVTSRVISDNKK